MLLEFLFSKIHRATVTDANLEYVGSITIAEDLMSAAKLQEWQKVEVLNINNGERFQTYVIKGKANSGEICINGAAARKAQKGDKVIIVSYMYVEAPVKNYKPTIVIVDEKNRIVKGELSD
ncbi:MAG: aspartate 1-decarboxylase [Candidatus Gastranaerophilaceae bacterium]